MGSGVWFKNIISKKKVKGDRSQKLKVWTNKAEIYSAPENNNGCLENECRVLTNGPPVDNKGRLVLSIEDAAATRVQSAYRAYSARRTLRQMKGTARLQNLVQRDFVKKQASTTLNHLHLWSRIQSQIRSRRAHMVTEGRLRQKKLESQLKLESKLHDLEVEWNSGSGTMNEALARIHKREDASVRRERTMAYAFSHQWRANSKPSFEPSNHELSKSNWGWSWTDRWIAARPWEGRIPTRESPKKAYRSGKNGISPTNKSSPAKVKLISPNGKTTRKARKLSFEPPAQKVNTKNEQEGS